MLGCRTRPSGLETFYGGLGDLPGLLVLDALRDLTPSSWDCGPLRTNGPSGSSPLTRRDPAPTGSMMSLGEGDPATRDLFRVPLTPPFPTCRWRTPGGRRTTRTTPAARPRSSRRSA